MKTTETQDGNGKLNLGSSVLPMPFFALAKASAMGNSHEISPQSRHRCSGQADRYKSIKSVAGVLNHANEELQDLVERITIVLELINVAKELER